MRRPVTENRYLPIYLRDHFAGSTAGIELARRMARSNRGSEFGPPLERIATEIAEDRAELRRIMRRLHVAPDPLKVAVAWAIEKAGRIKPNGQLRGYSPLGRVLEIEALIGGVNGKLSLWRNLHEVASAQPRLDVGELERLARRAEDQLERLHGLCGQAAARAFTAPR
jgi:hypothetical protein